MGLLDGKVALVSGVGPGMGRDISLQLAEHGADVVLGARTAANVRLGGRRGRGARPQGGAHAARHHRRRVVPARGRRGDVEPRPHRHPRQQRVPRRRPQTVREGGLRLVAHDDGRQPVGHAAAHADRRPGDEGAARRSHRHGQLDVGRAAPSRATARTRRRSPRWRRRRRRSHSSSASTASGSTASTPATSGATRSSGTSASWPRRKGITYEEKKRNSRARPRSGTSRTRRRSPARSCSSPPTCRSASPVRRSASTAATGSRASDDQAHGAGEAQPVVERRGVPRSWRAHGRMIARRARVPEVHPPVRTEPPRAGRLPQRRHVRRHGRPVVRLVPRLPRHARPTRRTRRRCSPTRARILDMDSIVIIFTEEAEVFID